MASKLLEQSLHELYGWYGDPVASAKAALDMDPSFVQAKAYLVNLDLLGTGTPLSDLQNDVEQLESILKSDSNASLLDRLHVKASRSLATGDMRAANACWEQILVENPTDAIALRFMNDCLFYLGRAREIKDVNLAVLPEWKKKVDSPLYSYVLGMTAFGLEEAGQYRRAEDFATQALALSKTDAWATHARAHVFEMEGRFHDGEHFLVDTEADWSKAGGLACHNYWHLCLYRIEQNRHLEALDVFDTKMASIRSPSILDMVDMAALLFRLEFENIDVGGRWNQVWGHWKPHLHDHLTAFNDTHIAMALLGASPVDVDIDTWLEAASAFALHGRGSHQQLADTTGQRIVTAVAKFKKGDYESTVQLLLPVRNDVDSIGGSHAQRDIVHQLLIQACLRSGEPQHSRLAHYLLNQRLAERPTSHLTKRLIERLQTRAASELHGYEKLQTTLVLRARNPEHYKRLGNEPAEQGSSNVARAIVAEAVGRGRRGTAYSQRVANKVVHLDNSATSGQPSGGESSGGESSGSSKRRRRLPSGRMTATQRRESHLFDIPKDKQKYDNFLPLHHLWAQYSKQLIGNDRLEGNIQMKLSKADWHGSIVSVLRSRCPSYVGLTGILVRETEHMFFVITKANALKMVPKRHSVFQMHVSDILITLYGNQLLCRTTERTARKFKSKSSIDL